MPHRNQYMIEIGFVFSLKKNLHRFFKNKIIVAIRPSLSLLDFSDNFCDCWEMCIHT